MRTEFLVAALLPVVVGAVACRSVPPHFYVITLPEVPAVAEDSNDDGVRLGIAPFTVDSPYDGDQLIYRVGRDSPEIAFYAHHRWAASLRDQLPLAATATFGDLPGVTSIAPIEVGRSYDGELVGRLLYLEELDVPGEQIARVGLELALLDRDNQQIWFQTVSAQVSGQAVDVPDMVRYMRRALQDALSQARSGLAAAVAQLRN